MKVTDLLGKKIIICDGAMGTMMQRHGLKTGELPEMLNFIHPEIIREIHEAYYRAGSDFVSTNTFGCNRYKVEKTGYPVADIIKQAVLLAKEAAGNIIKEEKAKGIELHKRFVALDVGPIGKLMEPIGELSFDKAYELFKEQVIAGEEAGADLILFETFTDIYEMKAAVLAALENTKLPVFSSLTFQEDGRMLMGTDPFTAVNILQDMGISAIGINCSLGPKQMVEMAKNFVDCAKIPVLIQPNAGLPKVVDGETVFDVEIDEYKEAMVEMLEYGVAIAGGCCGTNPEYIKAISEVAAKKEFPATNGKIEEKRKGSVITAVSSSIKTVVLDERIRIIGERINPTGKKLLKEALRSGDLAYIENEAITQVKAGADILDINVGLPEIDEKEMMLAAIKKVTAVVSAPLQIDSSDPEVIAAAARYYNGRSIINSVNGKKESLDAVLPIVKKYGTCVIALTLDENGLPKDAEERLEIAERIISEADKYGIGRERIIVDCLTLTVSAQQNAGVDTLKAITEVKRKFGVKTTLGASNVSFGLPERKLLNRTFLAMALYAGLDAPISDPTVFEYVDTIRAFEALNCKDLESKDYIKAYGGERSNGLAGEKSGNNPDEKKVGFSLSEIILEGYEDKAAAATDELLKTKKPLEIVEQIIIPTLEIAGKDYESGVSFLPQLIKSADTVKEAFKVLKSAMSETGGMISYGKIILATVEGDIHDIGKNIVKVILENYGYDVIDLGKDVSVETIVKRAKEENIKMVGLSALMTTTVVNMEKTIKSLKDAGVECATAVGGAVLTADYAEKIGADHYCKDAMDTVRVANSIFKGEK